MANDTRGQTHSSAPTGAAAPVATSAAPLAIGLVLLAAAGAFALTMGVRQTVGRFLSALNTSTALGIGSISLAFAFGQLWWGLTQPFAGAIADRIGTGRVLVTAVMTAPSTESTGHEHGPVRQADPARRGGPPLRSARAGISIASAGTASPWTTT